MTAQYWAALLFIGSLLQAGTFAWAQGRAVSRHDGELVPWWFVLVTTIVWAFGPSALFYGGLAAKVSIVCNFLMGASALISVSRVDRKRAMLAQDALLGRSEKGKRRSPSPPEIERIQQPVTLSVDLEAMEREARKEIRAARLRSSSNNGLQNSDNQRGFDIRGAREHAG